jgi:hypothetical protein
MLLCALRPRLTFFICRVPVFVSGEAPTDWNWSNANAGDRFWVSPFEELCSQAVIYN